MRQDKRWKEFLKYWNTIYAGDYDCVGDLVYEMSQKIKEIQEGK